MKAAACLIGLVAVAVLGLLAAAAERSVQTEPLKAPPAWLKDIPYRIVYETFRDGNWELYSIQADGSDPQST